jgi:iron uptake system EfeUOB component EfeO/EfeM
MIEHTKIIVDSFPKKLREKIYQDVDDSKKLFDKIQEILAQKNQDDLKNILPTLFENEILMQYYMNKDKQFKHIFEKLEKSEIALFAKMWLNNYVE